MSDHPSRPKQANPANPASDGTVAQHQPRWIRLDQLPGFMWQAIRSMGDAVFSPLTRTRLNQIEVIADLGGRGPHLPQDIDTTAHWLRRTCDTSGIVEYSADELAKWLGEAYWAQAVQFITTEYAYLLVQDAMGRYIYRWPAQDTKISPFMVTTSDKRLITRT